VRLTVTLARRPARSRLVALLAACCALAMLGSALHHLLTPHAVCAEHGEAIDATSTRALTPPPPTSEVESASPLLQDQHDHCALVHHRRQLWLGALTASVSRLPIASDKVTAIASRPTPEPHQPLLSLAPKSSPPAV
jgi:hypothetical protein